MKPPPSVVLPGGGGGVGMLPPTASNDGRNGTWPSTSKGTAGPIFLRSRNGKVSRRV